MKGKNQRSLAHKANQEAVERIADLEAEVERLHDIENVGRLHIQALGEIERLTAKVADLETKARDAERAVGRYLAALDKIRELELVIERRGDAIGAAIAGYMHGKDREVHPLDAIVEVYGMFGMAAPAPKPIERTMWERSSKEMLEAARGGRLRARRLAVPILAAIDAGCAVDADDVFGAVDPEDEDG